MTDHLASLLTAKVKQFDELAGDEVDTRGRDVGFDLYTVMNMMCTLEIDLTEPGETPKFVVHCDVEPGGRVGEVWIEARDGEASIRRYIEADSGLHRATQNWFTDAWDCWDEILEDDADGEQLGLHVVDLHVPEDTKTKAGRQVAVLAPEVSERLARRLDADSPWLFPAPSDPAKAWDPRNRDRKLAAVYKEVAEGLDIEMFQHERGHSWRTTNNTLLYDLLPEATRIRLFGHGKAVNRQRYTAVTTTEAIVSAASSLFET